MFHDGKISLFFHRPTVSRLLAFMDRSQKCSPYAQKMPPPGKVTKADIRNGSLLFLPRDARRRDRDTFASAGFPAQALGHPVIVVDALPQDPKYILIVGCTTGSSHRDELLLEAYDKSGMPMRCDACGRRHNPNSEYRDVLAFASRTMNMSKPSHVKMGEVFRVSIQMMSWFRGSDAEPVRLADSSVLVLLKAAEAALRRTRQWFGITSTNISADQPPASPKCIHRDEHTDAAFPLSPAHRLTASALARSSSESSPSQPITSSSTALIPRRASSFSSSMTFGKMAVPTSTIPSFGPRRSSYSSSYYMDQSLSPMTPSQPLALLSSNETVASRRLFAGPDAVKSSVSTDIQPRVSIQTSPVLTRKKKTSISATGKNSTAGADGSKLQRLLAAPEPVPNADMCVAGSAQNASEAISECYRGEFVPEQSTAAVSRTRSGTIADPLVVGLGPASALASSILALATTSSRYLSQSTVVAGGGIFEFDLGAYLNLPVKDRKLSLTSADLKRRRYTFVEISGEDPGHGTFLQITEHLYVAPNFNHMRMAHPSDGRLTSDMLRLERKRYLPSIQLNEKVRQFVHVMGWKTLPLAAMRTIDATEAGYYRLTTVSWDVVYESYKKKVIASNLGEAMTGKPFEERTGIRG